ncbi:MAG: patatin-like phospholipase family protein [Pseudomonadota bacterium]|nr:patatin-like phospholipase family protein [Pseudomonadota bacterium]
MDPTLSGGGFVAVNKAFEQFRNSRTQINIEDLPKSFAVAATDISNGHEVWLRDGPLLQAVQASSAIPGLFPAVRVNDQWLVDGALVNPVPVSLCRALGATVVIAVNLNSGVPAVPRLKMKRMDEPPRDLISRLGQKLGGRLGFLAGLFGSRKTTVPSLLEIMSASLDVMQDRITRSRLAGDPPDVMISPRVSHIGVLDFDRAEELITIGEESTLAMRPAIELAIRR